MDLIRPFVTARTWMNSACATNQQNISGAGQQLDASSFTAFTLTAASGTYTGGTIYVYGYGAS
jgi:hypothetical protein